MLKGSEGGRTLLPVVMELCIPCFPQIPSDTHNMHDTGAKYRHQGHLTQKILEKLKFFLWFSFLNTHKNFIIFQYWSFNIFSSYPSGSSCIIPGFKNTYLGTSKTSTWACVQIPHFVHRFCKRRYLVSFTGTLQLPSPSWRLAWTKCSVNICGIKSSFPRHPASPLCYKCSSPLWLPLFHLTASCSSS